MSPAAAGRLRSWLPPALLASAFFGGLVVRAGLADGFRFQRLIQVGEAIVRPEARLPGQLPRPGVGYDGQFYFVIAQDPFLRHPWTLASLDNTLRYRRIAYPLLAHALSLGRRELVPHALVAINLVALCLLAGILARHAGICGRSPWTALTAALFPGVWVPLLLDLTEPLHLLLLVLAYTAGGIALLAGLATLAKETSAIVLAGEAARRALARDWRGGARLVLVLVAYSGWAYWVYRLPGARESTLGGHLLAPPGAPFLALVRGPAAQSMLVLPAVAICILAITRLRAVRDPAAIGAAGYAVVALAAGNDTWTDPTAYFRVMAGALVLLYLSWCRKGDREGGVALGISAVAAAIAVVPIALLSLR